MSETQPTAPLGPCPETLVSLRCQARMVGHEGMHWCLMPDDTIVTWGTLDEAERLWGLTEEADDPPVAPV